jgi:hypothetical protein
VDELPSLLLVDAVQERLSTSLPLVKVSFGWREPNKQVNQGTGGAARVVFVPGDGTNAQKAGEFRGARNAGMNPRPLATFVETLTVLCWAFDATDPNNERHQYRAARLLTDAVVVAIQLAWRGEAANLPGVSVGLTDPEWVLKDVERRFGCELRFRVTVESLVLDTEDYAEQLAKGLFGAVLARDDEAPGTADDPPAQIEETP